jgi:hypothetical protein
MGLKEWPEATDTCDNFLGVCSAFDGWEGAHRRPAIARHSDLCGAGRQVNKFTGSRQTSMTPSPGSDEISRTAANAAS